MAGMLMDMMVLMMPWMKPILEIGVVAAAVGLGMAFFGEKLNNEERRRLGLLWGGRLAVGIGLFFLACQAMGALLGANPAFNLGDASKFEFWMVPFWQPGVALLIVGLFIGNRLADLHVSTPSQS